MRLESGFMKRFVIGLLAGIPLLAGLAFVSVAHAQTVFRSGNNAGVNAGETVNSTVFVSGRTIEIAGTVNGDVFCAGQNVNVSGTVNGDVICAGQTVRIAGTVNGDVRVAGQTVTIGSKIRDSLTVAGQTSVTEEGSAVGRDASVGGQDATLNGSVGRDLALGVQQAIINGPVGRDVVGTVDQLTLGSQADVAGSITYTSNNELRRGGGAQVGGDVSRKTPDDTGAAQAETGGIPWYVALLIFLSLLILSLVLVLFVPHVLQRTTTLAMRHPGKTFLLGLAGSIVGPIVIIGLMFTLIGIPVALMLLLIWLVLMLTAGPFAAYMFGRYLLQGRTGNVIWYMALGAAILLIVYAIPILGQIVALVAYWFGLGMLLWQVARRFRFRYRADELTANEEGGKRTGTQNA